MKEIQSTRLTLNSLFIFSKNAFIVLGWYALKSFKIHTCFCALNFLPFCLNFFSLKHQKAPSQNNDIVLTSSALFLCLYLIHINYVHDPYNFLKKDSKIEIVHVQRTIWFICHIVLHVFWSWGVILPGIVPSLILDSDARSSSHHRVRTDSVKYWISPGHVWLPLIQSSKSVR